MRKKFTMLLALAFLFVGISNAQVTKFYKPGERKTTLAAGDKVMFYNTTLVTSQQGETVSVDQDRTGFLHDNGSSLILSKTKPSQNPFFSEKVGVWTIETVEDNTTYYKVSVTGSHGYLGIAGVTNNTETRDLFIHKWTEAPSGNKAGVGSESATGATLLNENISASDNVWLVANGAPGAISTTWNGNIDGFATWSTGHPYAIYSVVEASTAELEALLTEAKGTARTELENLAQLSIFNTAATQAITSVEGVTLSNDDLETALNTINQFIVEAKRAADGKNLKFTNCATDGRGGNCLGYDINNNRAAAIPSDGDDVIWTIKSCEDGYFKLYNFVNNLYLGAPADPTPTHTNEAEAPSFKLISTDTNKAALVCKNGKMVHIANHSNYKVISYYSLSDAASLWNIEDVEEIVITRENYDAAVVSKANLPFAIQEAYGLVTDAAKYTSNAKESAEGSYEGLLDNTYNDPSYFHSSYNTAIGAYHYLQAELSESCKSFYFYYKKRQGNNNNRPTEIEIQGSTDGETFTPITTINSGLPTENTITDYMSEMVSATENVNYLRFVVKNTNTPGSKDDDTEGYPFFTFSEFYILSATNDVTSLVNAYNTYSTSSITSPTINEAATTLVNAETTLSLSNIKKEIAAMLSANATNHAEAPELGQYPTAEYNALSTAYNDANATQETLENAIATFEASKNIPVYFITSAHDDYAAGSAILYDGTTWKWANANIYNRQMWMTIPAYTQENVPTVNAFDANGTFYEICDYTTGKVMRDKKVQIVAIDGWENTFNLQYGTTDRDMTMHAAQNENNVVGWNTATTNDNKASAWHVEYIGNSFDLAQLTDEYLAKGNELLNTYNNTPAYNIAAGLNNYSEATPGRFAAAKQGVLDVLTNLSTKEDIAAAKAELEAAIAAISINQPESGKFYRLRCVGTGMKYLQSTLESNRFKMISGDAGKTEAATFCYYNGGLVAYTQPQYISHEGNNASYSMTPLTVLFEQNNQNVVGQYNIKVGNRYLFGAGDLTDSGNADPDAREGYRWWLEEVNTLPVAFGEALAATLYAPVALTIPDGVKAYTGSVNGEYVVLNEVSTTIPANTGVILMAEEAKSYDFAVTTTENTVEGNVLTGTVATINTPDDANIYTLQAPENVLKMKRYNGTTLAGFKAYLNMTASPVQAFKLDLGEATGIESILNDANGKMVIYDMNGRRVQQMSKGLYIVNGKKVLVK